MNFDRIRLRNFKPFGDGDLRLTDGVTVIHGLNGSGKSSLLESCFFALYGARALDATLEEVVTTGEDEADVELWFAHDGARYHVRRELRRRGDRVATATCTLERESDDVVVEGATDVRAFVTDLLRMDAEAFVNCAYVRQGEVNKLIEATPGERQRMIDDLLQLGTLEEYRDRAGDARLGVEDVLGEKRGELRRIEDQITELEERDLHDRLNALRSERNEVVAGEEGIEHYESQRETAVETRDEAESILQDAAEKRDELDDLEAEIEELEAAIRETADERDDLDGSIESARRRRQSADERAASLAEGADLAEASEAAIAERREALDDRESGLREELETARESVTRYENQAENLADRADDLADRAAEERERAEERETEAEAARETLTDLEDDLAAAESAVESLRARFKDAPVAVGGADEHREAVASELETVRGSYNDATAELQSARDDVAATEALLAAGNCPECGRPVEGSPEVASLETDRERVAELDDRVAELDDRREELTERLERADALVEAESRLADRRQRVELLTDRVEEKREAAAAAEEAAAERRAAAEEFDAEAEEKRELAAERRDELAEARATVADLEDELDAVEKRRERMDEIEAELESATDAAAEVERLSERRELLAERVEERRGRLSDLRERRDDLRDRIDEERVAAARDERERAAAYVERVDETLESLRERRDELQGQIGAVEQEIETLESLRADRDELAATVDRLKSLHSEAAELEAAYGDLRSELRRRNVDRLERTLNETFDLVYANDAYSRLELDEEYALTVYQKDGQPLRPEQLSGGERALFNLSLRCAIYRLLAEGVEGAAPTPPLILDEPTVFLDDGHVARLRRLVEEMRGFGVSQILIVSHDEELIAAADELVTVEKNPTTNRSSVGREPDPTVAAADVD